MGWRIRMPLFLALTVGFLLAWGFSAPRWLKALILLAMIAVHYVYSLYPFDSQWGRQNPRLRRRFILEGVAITLVVAFLLVLWSAHYFGATAGPGVRASLFFLYLCFFVGTVLFVRQVIAGKWNRR